MTEEDELSKNQSETKFESDQIFSIFVYGFHGKTSLDGSIKDSDMWLDGFAFAVCVKY